MITLNVPYAERATAARLGAKFDPVRKVWFVPTGALATPFERWLPKFEAPTKRKARGQRKARAPRVVEVAVVPVATPTPAPRTAPQFPGFMLRAGRAVALAAPGPAGRPPWE